MVAGEGEADEAVVVVVEEGAVGAVVGVEEVARRLALDDAGDGAGAVAVVEVDEVSEAIAGGVVVDGGTAQLRQLLSVLVACRDARRALRRAGATQDELCDWLWPDADGDKGAQALKVAIHRLRKWIGADHVVIEDGVVSLADVDVDLDDPVDAASSVNADVNADDVLRGCALPPVLSLRARLRGARPAA